MPTTEFQKDRTHSDGLKSSCKACRCAMEKKTRDARKAKLLSGKKI